MILPHPKDWKGAVHIVPVRVGDVVLAADSHLYNQPPYNRHHRLVFTLDEVRGTGEIMYLTRSAIMTGCRFVRGPLGFEIAPMEEDLSADDLQRTRRRDNQR